MDGDESGLKTSKRRKAVIIDKKQTEEVEELENKEQKRARRTQRVEGEEDDESNVAKFDMGFKLEPFNLKEEREGGNFDAQGNYQRDRRRKGDFDAWVDDEYEEQIQLYSTTGKNLPKNIPQEQKNILDEPEPINEDEMKKKIVSILQPGESVTQGLKRLGKEKRDASKGKPKTKTAKKEETPFDVLTECSHALLSNGYFNIYSTPREKIMKERAKSEFEREEEAAAQEIKLDRRIGSKKAADEAQKEHQPQETAQPAPSDNGPKWEYKGADGIVYGPYTTQQMIDWKEQGYFVGENAVQVRKIREESIFDDEENKEENWGKSDRIDFSDYL